MTFVRKQLPILIAFVLGFSMWVRFYVPTRFSEFIFDEFLQWSIILIGFALILGVLSLLHYHWNKIKRRQPGFAYSYVTYIAFAAMMVTGFISAYYAETGSPLEAGTPFHWMFINMMVPMQSTMFAILGFFIASAAFSAFRARTPEATLLLIAAILVMIGRVPIGEIPGDALWAAFPNAPEWMIKYGTFPAVSDWILKVWNMAGQRGILLGVGLAQVAIALRIIFGIERTYMGGE